MSLWRVLRSRTSGLVAFVVLATLYPLPATLAQTRLVVISGLTGDPKYAASFHAWSASLIDAARSRYGVADSSIVWLAEDPARAPGRIAAKSTKESIERTLDGLATRMGSGEQLLVVLIGHGSAQDDVPRLTLPGPDLSATDLARLVAKYGSRRVAVVVAASSSGDFVKALSGPGRVVITATKSGFERNESLFGGHFVAALAGDGADADKDGRVSLLEAFTYASREVRRVYEQENRLLTEHALLDDKGNARSFFLTGGGNVATAAASNDPRAGALRKEKQELESKIEALKARKEGMDAKAYEAELERLLVELAATTRALRALEGRAQ